MKIYQPVMGFRGLRHHWVLAIETAHVAVAVFSGSLSDCAFSVALAVPAAPSPRATNTGTVADSPNLTATSAFCKPADQPLPSTETDSL